MVVNVVYKKLYLIFLILSINYNYGHGICKSLTSSVTTNVTCTYNGTILNNCVNPIEGTIAVLSCNPFYEEISISLNSIRLCDEGNWNGSIPKCYPICGKNRLRKDSTDLNAQNKSINYPWHVGIYNWKKEYQCSGTIIDTNIVLTSAKCVTDLHGKIRSNVNNYLVAAGNYYSSYKDGADNSAQYLQVREINVPERYEGIFHFYDFDIAVLILTSSFLVSKVVQPVCIDLHERYENSKELLNVHVTKANCHQPPVGVGLVSKNIFNNKYYITAMVYSIQEDQATFFALVTYHTNFVKRYVSNHRNRKYCQLPNFPLHGKYIVRNRNDIIYEPGKYVLPHTMIFLNCNAGYEYDILDTNQFYCLHNGKWAPTLGECILISEPHLHYIHFISITVLVTFFVVAWILIKVFYIKKCRSELQENIPSPELDYFLYGDNTKFNSDFGIHNQTNLLPRNSNYEFPRDKLKLGKYLGSGSFGFVVRAEAFGIIIGEEKTTVAVKMVKNTTDYILYWKALASELNIMSRLGKHINVVELLGACTKSVEKCELFVIVEYCRLGNLYNYLLRNRTNYIDQIDKVTGKIDYSFGSKPVESLPSVPNIRGNDSSQSAKNTNHIVKNRHSRLMAESTTPTDIEQVPGSSYGNYKTSGAQICTKDLISWAFQVARGMEYLASKKILHGDLAARNILLADNDIVKICDFGLAKQLYKYSNYKKRGDSPLPMKWMAIESIRDRIFSTHSDVWSYGIMLWEFFSLSEIPYPEMAPDERLYKALLEGYRMESPAYATKEIYKIMSNCWNAEPPSRPSFGKLIDMVQSILEENEREIQNH